MDLLLIVASIRARITSQMNRLHNFLRRKLGSYLSAVTFCASIVVLTLLASLPPLPIDPLMSGNSHANDSVAYNRNETYFPTLAPTTNIPSFTTSPITSNNKTTISPTISPTNSSLANATNILMNDDSLSLQGKDGSYSAIVVFMICLFFMYGFFTVVQMIRMIRYRDRMLLRSGMGGLSGGFGGNHPDSPRTAATRAQLRHLMLQLGVRTHGSNSASRNNNRARLQLAMMNRDFNSEDYEMLRRLDEMEDDYPSAMQPRGARGLSPRDIERLPLHQITESETDKLSKSCTVCLAPYQVGDTVRILPCLHQFHQSCIDPWLKAHPTCPICKFNNAGAVGNGR